MKRRISSIAEKGQVTIPQVVREKMLSPIPLKDGMHICALYLRELMEVQSFYKFPQH